MGGTVSKGIELENSTKLLPALLAHHICSVHAPCLRIEWKRRTPGEGQQNPVMGHGTSSAQRQLKWTYLARGRNETVYGTDHSIERVKGIDLQYGAEVERHQMKCPSIK